MALRWNLTGTDAQKAIAQDAFGGIYFPFERLTQLPGTPELGWRDLNPGMGLSFEATDEPVEVAKSHGTHTHGDKNDKPDSLELEIAGRKWTLGVIYTQSGRIYLDVRLERDPALAKAVVAAEIAHAVDFFQPMSDEQRNEFLRLWNQPNTTWWEVADYGEEYFRLGGEAFMHEFVEAYTDFHFGNKDDFLHDVGVAPADTRRILGIERTDYVPAATLKRIGKSKIYHKLTHYPKKAGDAVRDRAGLIACKVCKP